MPVAPSTVMEMWPRLDSPKSSMTSLRLEDVPLWFMDPWLVKKNDNWRSPLGPCVSLLMCLFSMVAIPANAT
jgi:hypothetical protein